jgi:hypothetical protein
MLYAHSNIGLSPSLDNSDIGLKGLSIRYYLYQTKICSDTISDIRYFTNLLNKPHRFRIVLVVGIVPFYYSEYRISDCSDIGQIHIILINAIFDIEISLISECSDIGLQSLCQISAI